MEISDGSTLSPWRMKENGFAPTVVTSCMVGLNILFIHLKFNIQVQETQKQYAYLSVIYR